MDKRGIALLEIHPTDALIDAPVSIELSGFLAAQQVTLRARMPIIWAVHGHPMRLLSPIARLCGCRHSKTCCRNLQPS